MATKRPPSVPVIPCGKNCMPTGRSEPHERLKTLAGRSRSEVAVTRARTWTSNRSLEWARRPGASPSQRMIASWSGPSIGSTEYKRAAEFSRVMEGSSRFVRTASIRGAVPDLIKLCAMLATVKTGLGHIRRWPAS